MKSPSLWPAWSSTRPLPPSAGPAALAQPYTVPKLPPVTSAVAGARRRCGRRGSPPRRAPRRRSGRRPRRAAPPPGPPRRAEPGSGRRCRPTPLMGMPSSRTRTPVLAAPRRVRLSLWPEAAALLHGDARGLTHQRPEVVTSVERPATSITVTRPVGSRCTGGLGRRRRGRKGDVHRGEVHRRLGLGPGHRRHAQSRAETRPRPPPSAHRPPSALFAEERRPARGDRGLRRRTLGQVSWLTDRTQATPRWRLRVWRSLLPPSRGPLLPSGDRRRMSGGPVPRAISVHSGGTAPDSHRLPCWARHGHPGATAV